MPKGRTPELEQVTIDPEVMEQTKLLALAALKEAHILITEGSPQIKVTMIRTLMPTLARALERNKEDSTFDEIRTEMQTLMGEVKYRPPENLPPIDLTEEALLDKP